MTNTKAATLTVTSPQVRRAVDILEALVNENSSARRDQAIDLLRELQRQLSEIEG